MHWTTPLLLALPFVVTACQTDGRNPQSADIRPSDGSIELGDKIVW